MGPVTERIPQPVPDKKNLVYGCVPRRNLEAIGTAGANFRPFSLGGSVEPLVPGVPMAYHLVNLYIERKPFT